MGHPVGKGRARATKNGHHYTPKETVLAEATIRDAWSRASAPWIDGELRMIVMAGFARPKTHYLVSGDLSKAGLRQKYPARKPDGDNILKTIADSLSGSAYRDDADIIDWRLIKRWVKQGEPEFTLIVITKMGEHGDAAGDR